DLSTVAIEGGATFQIVAFQNGSDQKIAITLYRKAGGIWFSSNWDKIKASTQLQAVNPGNCVYVAGGGASAPAKVAAKEYVQKSSTTEIELTTYPNPFANQLNFNLQSPNDTHARLEMFDLNGRRIAVVFDKDIKANDMYNINYKPADEILPGVLLYRLTVDNQVFNGKVIYQWR
ncbi:MAG TPA: T9SS type A sorting domain-containing protein, partial [Paludibacter sp.]|nr:T9SS type A sorting domain-containing protein [Paludibacter sp.]